jgi:hypothetical protein
MDTGRGLSVLEGLFRSGVASLITTNCRFTRPQLEPLEDRCVPSGLAFAAQYGAQVTTVGHDVLTGNVPVYLIFAGGQGAVYGQDGTVTTSQITAAVDNILSSSFLSGLAEYGAATHAYLAGTAISNYDLPRQFTDNGNGSDINKLVNASLVSERGSLPEPGATTPNGIYLVITPQGYSLKGQPDDLGHHSSGFAGNPLAPEVAYDGVILSELQFVPSAVPAANQSGATVHFSALSSLGTMTETLSHELVEMLTDPDGNGSGGVDTTPSASFNANFSDMAEAPGEVSDNEGEFYVGYENGTLVQSYWSNLGSDFIIPGATLQDIALEHSVLTVNGDRLGQAVNDSLILATTASGGLQVTLDGETQQYAPRQITALDVILGQGNNTLQVLGLPSNVSVHVDNSTGTTTLLEPISSWLSQVRFSSGIGSTEADTGQAVSAALPPTVQSRAGSTSNPSSLPSGTDSVVHQSASAAHDERTGPASVPLHLGSATLASPNLLGDLLLSSAPGARTAAAPAEPLATTASFTHAVDLGMAFIDDSSPEPSWLQGWRKTSDWSL